LETFDKDIRVYKTIIFADGDINKGNTLPDGRTTNYGAGYYPSVDGRVEEGQYEDNMAHGEYIQYYPDGSKIKGK